MENVNEGREGGDRHVDRFLADIDKLEKQTVNGQVQPFSTLDFNDRNPDSPWYEAREIKLMEAADKLAEIMADKIKDDGVASEASLKLFKGKAKQYLDRESPMRNHVAELYLRARGGDAEFTRQALEQMYGRLKEAFFGEFKKPFTAGQPVQPARTVQRAEQPQPTQVKKRRGVMKLDEATIRKLGYNQADYDHLRDSSQYGGNYHRTHERDKRAGTG